MEISQLSLEQIQKHLPDLIALLKNAVDDGASIGWIAPLNEAEAQRYWQSIMDTLENRAVIARAIAYAFLMEFWPLLNLRNELGINSALRNIKEQVFCEH